MKLKNFSTIVLSILLVTTLVSCSNATNANSKDDDTNADKASTLMIYLKGTAAENGKIEFSDCSVDVNKGENAQEILKKLSQSIQETKIWSIEASDDISISLKEKEVGTSEEPDKAKEIKGLKLDYFYSNGQCCLL